MIASAALPPSAASRHFSSRADTVLSYVAQLAKMPKSMLALEAWAATKICRFLGSGLSANAAQKLPKLGCPKLTSITAACAAAMTRTAVAAGRIQWKELLRRCIAVAEERRLLHRRTLDGTP